MKGHKRVETRIDEQLKRQGIDEYEQHEVSYTVPAYTTLTNPILNYQTVSTLNQRVGFYPRIERNIYSSENRILRWIYDLFYSPQTLKYTKVLKLLTSMVWEEWFQMGKNTPRMDWGKTKGKFLDYSK